MSEGGGRSILYSVKTQYTKNMLSAHHPSVFCSTAAERILANHIILFCWTLCSYIFAGHQEKLQDTNTTYMYTQNDCSRTRMRTRVSQLVGSLKSSSGGSRGGLRVLKHPPKLPKVNYLLLLLITVNSLSEFMCAKMTSKVGVAPKISRAPFFYSLSTPLPSILDPPLSSA